MMGEFCTEVRNNELGWDWRSLVTLTKKFSLKNKIFDALICICRGGSCPTRILSDLLDINIIHNIRVQYYEDVDKRKLRPSIEEPIQADIGGKHLLVCDDVSDTGNTLITVKDYLLAHQCGSITTATLYIKPWTKLIPDLYVKTTKAWIIFPWERVETLEKLTNQYLKEGKSLEELKRLLLSARFPSHILEYYFSS